MREANEDESPLFTTYMYQNLGSQWGSSIPAFLALVCAPLPFLFYRFGDTIRAHSKYAAKAQQITAQMLDQKQVPAIARGADDPEKAVSSPADSDSPRPGSHADTAVESDGRELGPDGTPKGSSAALARGDKTV